MTVPQIIDKLKALANEKVYAHNLKFGAHDNQFGVKLGDIRAIAKTIKINNELARSLWETGNIEARLLATLVIDPKSLSIDELDAMVRSERFSQVADWLNAYVVKEYPDKNNYGYNGCNRPTRWLPAQAGALQAAELHGALKGLISPPYLTG